MPRPLLRYLSRVIEEQGGDDVIMDRLAAGETWKSIISDYENPKTKKPFTRGMIYHWIQDGGEERVRKWKEAKAIAAYAHAEDAGEILDNDGELPITSAEVGLIKERAKYRQWLAGKYNQKDFGEAPAQAGNVNINLGSLHLGALQKAAENRAQQIEADEDEPKQIEEADVEIVDDADDDDG